MRPAQADRSDISGPTYAVPDKALRLWTSQRLGREVREDGSTVYCFAMSGSTCNNMGRPLEVTMTVVIDAQGRIESASSRPAASDVGCDAMCAAEGDGARFLADSGHCNEVVGLTLEQAAFRDWCEEPSGCLCSAGNRRHKWRNVFQVVHYATTHSERSGST